MSTRALYTFADNHGEYHVYKHHDGYPDDGHGNGGIHWIRKALTYAWPLPRFEADEFAASFIAANKEGPGDIRLLSSGNWKDVAPWGLEYRYHVECIRGALKITVWEVDFSDEWTETILCNDLIEAPIRENA